MAVRFSAVFAEEPRDLPPIPQNNLQMPEKPDRAGHSTSMPFSGGFEGSYKAMKIVELLRWVKIKGEAETGNENTNSSSLSP